MIPITYELKLVRDHLLIETGGGLALIDTGSPTSYADAHAPPLHFAGKVFYEQSCSSPLFYETNKYLGVDISYLIGMDILIDYTVLVNWPDRKLVVDPFLGDLPGAMPWRQLDYTHSIPTLEFDSVGRRERAYLDTGAHLSYAPREFLGRNDNQSRERDFHPQLGSFETDVATLRLTVGNYAIPVRCGVLPRQIQPFTTAPNPGWILGSDVFRFRTVILDFPGRRYFLTDTYDSHASRYHSQQEGVTTMSKVEFAYQIGAQGDTFYLCEKCRNEIRAITKGARLFNVTDEEEEYGDCDRCEQGAAEFDAENAVKAPGAK